jgi:hypothetical protein
MYLLLAWVLISLPLAIFLGKMLKANNPCEHEWVSSGYGGEGWTLSGCRRCGVRRLDQT